MIKLLLHYNTYTAGYSSVHDVGRPQTFLCYEPVSSPLCLSVCVNHMICLETADMKMHRTKFLMNNPICTSGNGFSYVSLNLKSSFGLLVTCC